MPSEKRCTSLPLLPLSPLPVTSSSRLPSQRSRDHKLRSSSSSSKSHRRTRSSNILLTAIQKISNSMSCDERSTMSLCSVTSDEYDVEDTCLDSFDDIIECDDGRSTMTIMHPTSSSYPTFPLCTRDTIRSRNSSEASWVVTPPIPTRLTLKMRPSSFTLPIVGDGNSARYDESEDYSDDEFITFSVDNAVPPFQIPTAISESVSYDEIDENMDNCQPLTPPSCYQEDGFTNPRYISSPPVMRLIPKRMVYLPFDSHNSNNHFGNNASCSTWDSSNRNLRTNAYSFDENLRHLLLPDDF